MSQYLKVTSSLWQISNDTHIQIVKRGLFTHDAVMKEFFPHHTECWRVQH